MAWSSYSVNKPLMLSDFCELEFELGEWLEADHGGVTIKKNESPAACPPAVPSSELVEKTK